MDEQKAGRLRATLARTGSCAGTVWPVALSYSTGGREVEGGRERQVVRRSAHPDRVGAGLDAEAVIGDRPEGELLRAESEGDRLGLPRRQRDALKAPELLDRQGTIVRASGLAKSTLR